ncbi:MAG: hypothetical protein IT569_02550 [Leptospiraceae bacterium]|nr:hypothetical protein [Leptospiraceae bacterium]
MKQILLILFFIFSCKGNELIWEARDVDKDGKNDQFMVSLKSNNTAVLLLTDERKAGRINDYAWVKAKDDKSQIQLFYNESFDVNGKVNYQLWYGPDSIKLIEKQDMNKDGFLETTTYFNRNAKPKIMSNHVARLEFDSNQDGKTDIWYYPNAKIEFDLNFDGIPDKFSSGTNQIAIPDLLDKEKIKSLKVFDLSRAESFAVHPELIKSKELQAIIPFSY